MEPVGVGDLLAQFLEPVWLGVSGWEAGAGTLDVLLAPAAGGAQDLCQVSHGFDADYGADPFLTADLGSFTWSVEGLDLDVLGGTLEATVAPDGSWLSGAELTMVTDTRGLNDLFLLPPGDDQVCEFYAALGIACEDCGNGDEYCLSYRVVDVPAEEVPATQVVPRSEGDIAGDPGC